LLGLPVCYQICGNFFFNFFYQKNLVIFYQICGKKTVLLPVFST
jgi:hypothetical protein